MKFLDFIKKHKFLLCIFLIILIIFLIIMVLFKKNPEIFNFKTIVYKRSSVCNTKEIISEKAFEKNLYQILGTLKYSDKLFVVNNFNVDSVSFKTYKNKPAKIGVAEMFIKDCLGDNTNNFKGKYEFIDDYVVVYLETEVYIFYYNENEKTLIDYNSYVQEGKENYILK